MKFLKEKRKFDPGDKEFEKIHRNMMTAEELVDFKNLFDVLDEDGSEFIDRNELKRALKKLSSEQISDEDIAFFMTIIDG